VQVDGTVNVCCFDYNGELEIGDLKKQNFSEIFNGEPMEKIQQLHSSGKVDELPLCAQCDQRNSPESKQKQVIYNSQFSAEKRIHTTSTDYENLLS
jgi:radical SAM protein with 4Fe4S-binding SPASM domain